MIARLGALVFVLPALASAQTIDTLNWGRDPVAQVVDGFQRAPARSFDQAQARVLALYRSVAKFDLAGGGLRSPDEIEKTRLGDPLPIYSVRADHLAAYAAAKPPEALLLHSGRVFLPVLVDSEPRASVLIQRTAGEWTLVALGEGPRAPDCARARPSLGQTRPTDALFLVHVPALEGYWLARRSDGKNVQDPEPTLRAIELVALRNLPRYGVATGRRETLAALMTRLAPHAAAALNWSKQVGSKDPTPPGPGASGAQMGPRP